MSEYFPVIVDPERIAQLMAHRACIGVEHDPANGKLHGYCVVCGVPWPCDYAGKPPAATQEQPVGSGASELKWFDAYHNQVKLTEELLRRQRLSILKGVQSKKNALSIARGVFDEHLAKAIAELEQEVSMTNVTGADNVSIPSLTKPQSGEHGADLQSTSVTTSRRIEWFCQMCQKNHVAYCPVVDEEKFLHICDECGQSYQGSKHECVGSPRKVGEDGALKKNPLLLLPDNEWGSLSSDSQRKIQKWFEVATEHLEQMLRPTSDASIREALEKLPRYVFAPETDACCRRIPTGSWLMREDVLKVLRPSSVPVGEQKQEKGV